MTEKFDFKSLNLSKEPDQKKFDGEFGKLSEEERDEIVDMAQDEAQKINEEKRLAQGQKASEVFSGKSESKTVKELYGESAKIISDIIRERLVNKEKIYKFVDFGSHKGELMKNVLDLLPEYNFHTIAIDVESVLKDNNIAIEKIVADLTKKIPLEDNGVDIGMVRYVLQWNDQEKQQAILKEVSRIVKYFAVLQHAGADNNNPDDWRENMNKFLDTTSKIKISGRFFSSGEEVEKLMINNGINFKRVMERKIEKVSNVFIEKMALNESEAQIARDLLGDKDYIIQTTWLIFGQNREKLKNDAIFT